MSSNYTVHNPRLQLAITPLPHPERAGDWHDAPLKWALSGLPWLGGIQKFSTKKEAKGYASAARRTRTHNECYALWVAEDRS